ncbi:MAG: ABC transporter substrate-binding protein [Actinobacteria bacterium]|nr:ABC transporter substrate-binding protein [Actinomycetota bacterium]
MRLVRAGVVVMAMALLALSCSGGDGTDTPSASTSSTASAGEPRFGGTLVVGTNADPGPLNPGITTSVPTHVVTGPMFNGLVGIDQELQPTPDLATSWEISPDGLTTTFRLAQDVRWHDGQPFSSADVKFTFEQILLPFSARTKAALTPVLAGIDAPDDTTVTFRFSRPYPAFLALIDKVNAPILPRHLYEGTDPMTNPVNQRPVGTGAFKFASATPGNEYRMVRNDDYFGEDGPYLDEIVVRVIPEQASLAAAFEAGEVDYLPLPPEAEVDRLAELDGVVATDAGREAFASVTFLVFNLERPALQDRRVREALALAVDKQFIIDAVLDGNGIPTTGPISPDLVTFYSDDVVVHPPDAERARTLLADAGAADLALTFVHDPSVARLAAVLKDQLDQIGIDLQLVSLERNAWIDRLYKAKDFDLSYTNFENGPDPAIGVHRAFLSSNIGPVPFSNAAQYRNPEVDDLLTRAGTTVDTDERVKLYDEFQKIVSEELPYLYLYQVDRGVLYRSEFGGLHDDSGKAIIYYEDAYSREGEPQPPSG